MLTISYLIDDFIIEIRNYEKGAPIEVYHKVAKRYMKLMDYDWYVINENGN